MIQKLYEFLLDLAVDNITLYNFLVKTFPTLNNNYIDRMERRLEKVYIPQEELDKMSHNVWQGLCDHIPTLDRSKY